MKNQAQIKFWFDTGSIKELSFKLYTLTNPITNRVFYVGCTQRKLEIRLAHHIAASRGEPGSLKKHSFIRDLVAKNAAPLIDEIETVTITS